jgi:hypothetical protein
MNNLVLLRRILEDERKKLDVLPSYDLHTLAITAPLTYRVFMAAIKDQIAKTDPRLLNLKGRP